MGGESKLVFGSPKWLIKWATHVGIHDDHSLGQLPFRRVPSKCAFHSRPKDFGLIKSLPSCFWPVFSLMFVFDDVLILLFVGGAWKVFELESKSSFRRAKLSFYNIYSFWQLCPSFRRDRLLSSWIQLERVLFRLNWTKIHALKLWWYNIN